MHLIGSTVAADRDQGGMFAQDQGTGTAIPRNRVEQGALQSLNGCKLNRTKEINTQ
jgi:hypothetical protein